MHSVHKKHSTTFQVKKRNFWFLRRNRNTWFVGFYSQCCAKRANCWRFEWSCLSGMIYTANMCAIISIASARGCAELHFILYHGLSCIIINITGVCDNTSWQRKQPAWETHSEEIKAAVSAATRAILLMERAPYLAESDEREGHPNIGH